MGDNNSLVAELFGVLERLAAPAKDQIAYLRNLGTSPSVDELALELNDVAFLVPKLVEDGRISRQQADCITIIERKLSEMSGQHNFQLWTEDALRHAADWEDVRRLAAAALVGQI
jgi:hypothetical protein